MTRGKKTSNFETSLKNLEDLVNQIEQGELTLDEALKAFEKGVKLTHECQTILEKAEQKIQILTEKNNQLQSQPFNHQEDK